MPDTRHLDVGQQGRLLLAHGHRLPSHTHDRGHLVAAVAGVLAVTTTAGSWIAPPTRVAWTPAAFEHHHTAHGHAEMLVLFVPEHLAARLPQQPAVLALPALAREVLLALTAEGAARGIEATERLHAVVIDELAAAPQQPLHLPEPADDRLRALTRILYSDPANQQSLAELGHLVGASERTLSRLFSEQLQMTFRQWRTQLRIHHALVQLAQGRAVTDTAFACGWANPTSFIEAFSALVGETPGRYRQRQLDPTARP